MSRVRGYIGSRREVTKGRERGWLIREVFAGWCWRCLVWWSVPRTSLFRVNGKLVAWSFPDRSTRPIVRRPDVLAVRTENLWEKDALLNLDPETFFTTDHYNGYPAILIRLAEIDVDELRGLLVAAWRTRAPKRVVREFDAKA